MSDAMDEILRVWPERFRFRRLVTALHDEESPQEVDAIDAVLGGLANDDDEQTVFLSLLEAGDFGMAVHLLEECPASRRLRNLRRKLLKARWSEALQDVQRKASELSQQANDAGLPIPTGLEKSPLLELSRHSLPEALGRLREVEQNLDRAVAEGREELKARVPTERHGTPWGDRFDALVQAGFLRAAARMIEQGAEDEGPEAVPPLPYWAWGDTSPSEVLDWHLDPGKRCPNAFRAWLDIDETSKALIRAFSGLPTRGHDIAVEFVQALDEFLHAESLWIGRLDPVGDEFLTLLPSVFASRELQRFRPQGSVDLFVGGPGTRHPEELAGLRPFAAVGPDMARRSGRGQGAVLDLRSLLQLVNLRTGRAAALLRILGPQWPLSTFVGETPEQLDEYLGVGDATRWTMLRWIVDLTGLGGATVADGLAYETGSDPELLQLFLRALAERQERPQAGSRPWLTSWRHDREFVASIERAVLRPLEAVPVARIAFWAALAAAAASGESSRQETEEPGNEVTASGVLSTVHQASAEAEPDDQEQTHGEIPQEEELRGGLAQLARLRLTVDASTERVWFRSCGVLLVLGSFAEERLVETLAEWRTRPEEGGSSAERTRRSWEWQLRRHALSPDYEDVLALLEKNGEIDPVDPRWIRLTAQTNDLSASASQIDGETDLTPLLHSLGAKWESAYPGWTVAIRTPPTAVARVSARAAQVLLYELLANAADALAGSGTGAVSVSVEPQGEDDWLVDVLDSGPGIGFPEGREHLVFRDLKSTRGEGRGRGLYRARQVALEAEGDLTLHARANSHPVLRGAHFRLVLPMA
ncbi:ATP-binding protein [Streptomyces sp. RKAG293]|uniref:ATP-binding protein n=1 Tax=Streptomyces sp. RKAG293 TaxID=2893403 RepID=UPI0020342341|nr:ATP-binding protein [Streptomyces sp. RKAG293]MCM2422857.1 ATP-binding protein [Streptomyces sp. RKAG293]